ncbi:MAG: glycoside hydrolase family 3 C-terminal domain-containing protein [Paramuribaculum sp.]|nr:glycoside hydrolase family 3 C-terminal domain-containing protein [Paramuribaculum sp.]
MKTRMIAAVALALAVLPSQAIKKQSLPHKKEIYHKGWIDFNKNGVMDVYENPAADTDARILNLLSQMTLEEKSCQLATYYGYKKALADSVPTAAWKEMVLKDGIANIDEHLNREVKDAARLAESLAEVQRFFVEHTRLGIPVDFTNEGIRGLTASGATSFPSMNGLGCTWDTELAYLQGRVEGREARALGYTNVYAPILDVARDQRWGRWDGSIAEEPFLVAEIGVAMAKGIQDERVVSTPKHFVGYGDCKGARQWDARTDPHITPSEMFYIHEYPFRRVFGEANALGVMCSYADYDGDVFAGSRKYLRNLLRDEMGFKGYVVSDSYAIGRLSDVHHVAADHKDACRMALQAGLNVRTDFTAPDEYIGNIRKLVEEGAIETATVDSLVADVLRVKFWLGLFDNPYTGDKETAGDMVGSPEHMDVALRASRECIVLLKNDSSLLPLGNKYKRIAVVGPNATGSQYVSTHYGPSDYKGYVSLLQGLTDAYGSDTTVSVEYARGIDLVSKGWPANELIPDTLTAAEQAMIDEAVSLARRSDVVVLAVGDGVYTSGESRTRTSLDLPGHQQALVEAMVATGKPVVMVLIWGRPASINYADRYCGAVLAAGYPGAQAGTALAEAIKGDYNPGGKLNGTWPRSVGQLPMNVPTKPNANYEPDGYSVSNTGLLYCFGHGLSYTKFGYDNLVIENPRADGNVTVSCRVTNTGDVAGDEVVQMYLRDVVSSTTTYEKNLRGFRRISLVPGETRTVSFDISPDDIVLINAAGEKVVEPGEFKVMIGSSYDDIRLSDSFWVGSEGARLSTAEGVKAKMMNDVDID